MFWTIFLQTDTNMIDSVLQLSFELRSVLMIERCCCNFYQTDNMFMIVTVNSSEEG